MMFTITKPIETAKTVVRIYKPMVLPPILDNFEMSFKSEIPLINEAKIKGTAINFNKLIKMVPNGFTQSTITSFPQVN